MNTQGIKMFNTSNYYQQSQDLPAQNGYQLMLLKLADTSTDAKALGLVD